MLLQVATNIVASLLAMEAMNDSEDIKLYINSPGQLITADAPLLAHPRLRQRSFTDKVVLKLVSMVAGGQSYSVIALLDTIEAIKPDVCTIALGLCASTATVLLAAGAKGKRFAMPSARIMMHQPAGHACCSLSIHPFKAHGNTYNMMLQTPIFCSMARVLPFGCFLLSDDRVRRAQWYKPA